MYCVRTIGHRLGILRRPRCLKDVGVTCLYSWYESVVLLFFVTDNTNVYGAEPLVKKRRHMDLTQVTDDVQTSARCWKIVIVGPTDNGSLPCKITQRVYCTICKRTRKKTIILAAWLVIGHAQSNILYQKTINIKYELGTTKQYLGYDNLLI